MICGKSRGLPREKIKEDDIFMTKDRQFHENIFT
jgi:hypothetical protein